MTFFDSHPKHQQQIFELVAVHIEILLKATFYCLSHLLLVLMPFEELVFRKRITVSFIIDKVLHQFHLPLHAVFQFLVKKVQLLVQNYEFYLLGMRLVHFNQVLQFFVGLSISA